MVLVPMDAVGVKIERMLPVFGVYDEPFAAVYFLHVRANGGDSARRAALEIGRVLLAYHAHLAFEAGRAFSDAAILAYADRDMGIPLYSFANDVREGFHLAETT